MPALPSSLIEPLWDQFAALIPPHVDTHPLGCHRPRIADRVVFDKLLQVLVLGASYDKASDSTCSATTIRTRCDEWIHAGVFDQLEQLCLDAYDQIVGLDLSNVTVDGCIVKAPCGGEAAGKSPVDARQTRHETVRVDRRRRDPARVCDRPGEPARLPAATSDPGHAGPLRPGPGLDPSRADHRASGRRLRQHQDPRPPSRAGLPRRDQPQGLSPSSRRPMGG